MLNMNAYDMIVVGTGIFGITTALELKARGDGRAGVRGLAPVDHGAWGAHAEDYNEC